jgi:hypothetical protein
MGRPLNKRLFKDNAKNNIKVQFHNGLNSVRGYIVEQMGTKKFKCRDENGVTAVCRVVMKDSAALLPGEMSITVKYDDGTVRHVYKIAAHRISVNPATNANTKVGMATAGWSFSTSTTDLKWQIEEAGTNTSMASAIDLEGDDDPNADYPVPGSGTYLSTSTAFNGMSYATIGTTATVTGGITTVPNGAPGLMRTKYAGHYVASSGGSTSTWNMNFFSTSTVVRRIADTHVSWGNQVDTPSQQNFAMEFKGYVKVPTTQNYNFYAQVDDDCAMWLGSSALDANIKASNTLMYGANKTMPNSTIVNINSQRMTANTWYPVRIWMTEFTGASKLQIFAIGADGTTYNGETLNWSYNTSTLGY